MIPDLINHHLCASTTNEVTNAARRPHDARTHSGAQRCEALDVPRALLPRLHRSGTMLGNDSRRGGGLAAVARRPSTSPAHDTASAIAGTPLNLRDLDLHLVWNVGTRRVRARCGLTTGEALVANVTNEAGVDNTTRLLKNVTG